MKDKIASIVLSILLILIGIRFYFYRSFNSWKFGHMDIGPYHTTIGLIFIILGLIFVFILLKGVIGTKDKNFKNGF
jgi:hypothetical protein